MIDVHGPDLCYNLAARRSARGITRLYDRLLAPTGISSSQFSILSLIEAHPGIKVADLARSLVMERTTLVRGLKPLQASGWVGETAGARGALELSLTELGAEKLANARPYWETAQQEYERQVGNDRAALLRNTVIDMGFHE